MRPRFRVRQLAADELRGPLLDQALWVFSGALGFQRRHGREVSFGDTLRRHTTYRGFLSFGAFNLRQRLVGFSYGYSSQPGSVARPAIPPPPFATPPCDF